MTDHPKTPGFLQRNRDLLVNWGIFIGVLGLFVAASEYASYWVNRRFAELTAWAMAGLLRLAGLEGHADGKLVRCSICAFEIIGECTAYFPMSIYVAAVAAYPCRIWRRLAGIALGIPTLFLINQGRLISLCFIHKHWRDQFETMHVVVWQSLIIFLTVLVWVAWVTTLGRDDATGST